METIYVIIHAKDFHEESGKYLTLKAERVAKLEALSGWLPAIEQKSEKIVRVFALISDWKSGDAQDSDTVSRERINAALAKIGLKVVQ